MASERNGTVELVCGKNIVKIDGAGLQREAALFDRAVIDLGAGDGRFAYRLARAHPAWFLLAIDPNAGGMRESSYRAGRKASRGGITNVRYVRASVENLPVALDGLADEICILYPWGSLLKALTLPRPELLAGIAGLGKPGALLRVRINASALGDRGHGVELETRTLIDRGIHDRLLATYAAAGIFISVQLDHAESVRTSWGLRINHGRPSHDIALDGIIGLSRFRGSVGPKEKPEAETMCDEERRHDQGGNVERGAKQSRFDPKSNALVVGIERIGLNSIGMDHLAFGMGASRNAFVIGMTQSARLPTAKWSEPGRTAN